MNIVLELSMYIGDNKMIMTALRSCVTVCIAFASFYLRCMCLYQLWGGTIAMRLFDMDNYHYIVRWWSHSGRPIGIALMMDPCSWCPPIRQLQLVNMHTMAWTIGHYQNVKHVKREGKKCKHKHVIYIGKIFFSWCLNCTVKIKAASDLIGKHTGPTAGLNSIGPVLAIAISFSIDNGS